jgi:hypothetical protein
MHADLDTLLITVYCMADDLLPRKPDNARRRVTDAEVVTLCVAQAIIGEPEDPRFLARARKELRHLFPELPRQPGYWKRRHRLAATIERLVAIFAAECPGAHDDLVLIDSTPVECGRSVETTRRSALAPWCANGYCASHSRHFWGMRLHGVFGADGTPRAWALAPANVGEREMAAGLLASTLSGGEAVIGDKGYAGADFEDAVGALGATVFRPARRDEPGRGPHLAPIRQRIESIFWTLKNRLGLERHQARTLTGLRARTAAKLLALAAGVWLNWTTGQPTRAFAALAT